MGYNKKTIKKHQGGKIEVTYYKKVGDSVTLRRQPGTITVSDKDGILFNVAELKTIYIKYNDIKEIGKPRK